MKALTTAITVFIATSLLHADEFHFQYHRFGHIALETAKGKEHVVILAYSKTPGDEQTIFQSSLTRSSAETYVTPKGTIFALKHLSKPVINDGNRHINSGDWQLTVSGKGAEFTKLKPKMPVVAFGDTPPLVYLGQKASD
jgi:hypothetical protein